MLLLNQFRLSGLFEDVDESELGDESRLLQLAVEVVLVVTSGVVGRDFVEVVVVLNSVFIELDGIDGSIGGTEV